MSDTNKLNDVSEEIEITEFLTKESLKFYGRVWVSAGFRFHLRGALKAYELSPTFDQVAGHIAASLHVHQGLRYMEMSTWFKEQKRHSLCTFRITVDKDPKKAVNMVATLTQDEDGYWVLAEFESPLCSDYFARRVIEETCVDVGKSV